MIVFCVTPSEEMGSIDQEISNYFNVAQNGKEVATTTFPGKKHPEERTPYDSGFTKQKDNWAQWKKVHEG